MHVKRPGDRRSLSRSATRALDVLEYFGLAQRPLRAIEIALRLDLHPSTANQLLKTMVESAHLSFNALTKTYLPSPRLAQFGGWIVRTYGGDARLRGLVRTIQTATGMVVTLTTPNDLYMQVVDLAGVDGNPQEPGSAERGLQVSLFGTAIGAAYLSTLADAEIIRLAIRARMAPDEQRKLLRWIARVRMDGFADSASPDPNLWSIAAPLQQEDMSVPLVLGLAGPAERICAEAALFGSMMQTAIARFSSAGSASSA